MKGPFVSVALGLACVLVFSGAWSAESSDAAVWVTSSLERVGQTGVPGYVQDVDISAARGEAESFQIVVGAATQPTQITSIWLSDLTNGATHTISRENFTIYTEHYVQVSPGSPDEQGPNRPLGPGWYADALIPLNASFPLLLDAGKNQPFWVDLEVPPSTAAGIYRGSFTVQMGQTVETGNIRLRVWGFTLPQTPALKSSFGLQGPQRRAGQEELLKNRVSPAFVDLAREREFVDEFGLSAVGLGFWSGGNIGNCRMSEPPSVFTLLQAKSRHVPDAFLYNYTADEIARCANLYNTLAAWARNLHQAGIRNLVTIAPVPPLFDDGSGTGRSVVDIWVMLPMMFDQSFNAIQTVLAKGDEVWSYNALSQDTYSPKWLLDYDPLNFRLQPGWISQSLGLTGILYWRADFWSASGWDQVNNSGTFGRYNAPGEGLLLYPGDALGIGGVLPSMRLKWIRDGVEDYGYVDLLKKHGRESWALAQIRGVAPDWSHWSRDPKAIEQVRLRLAGELEALEAGTSGQD